MHRILNRIVRKDLQAPSPLPPKKKVSKSLEKKFNKKIEGKVVIDKNIIGGTKIVVGDSVIDASVRAQLDNLAFTLKA